LEQRVEARTRREYAETNALRPGLRGRMEAGFSRMNDLIVIQASQVYYRLSYLVRDTNIFSLLVRRGFVPTF
jgi:hypothetical protein